MTQSFAGKENEAFCAITAPILHFVSVSLPFFMSVPSHSSPSPPLFVSVPLPFFTPLLCLCLYPDVCDLRVCARMCAYARVCARVCARKRAQLAEV